MVTEFAEKVYAAVSRIPAGRVATYGQVAEMIGRPGAVRAVGNALHVNPFAPEDGLGGSSVGDNGQIAHGDVSDCLPVSNEGRSAHGGKREGRVVPCHRVVAADGSLAAHFGCGGPSVQYARLISEGVTFIPGSLSGQSGRASSETVPAIPFPDGCPVGKGTSGPLPKVDLAKCGIVIESHPLKPFLPANGRILFLGSFPPPKERWSMEFFYPNWINDFWRIQGLLHFEDAHHFEIKGEKRFDYERIVGFCRAQGLAFFDTAAKVCRLKGNASDEFLEILEPSDIQSMLTQMPDCHIVVTTGGKSSEEFAAILAECGTGQSDSRAAVPKPGSFADVTLAGRPVRWWRMPSTSRAYPMSLSAKAGHYARLSDQAH